MRFPVTALLGCMMVFVFVLSCAKKNIEPPEDEYEVVTLKVEEIAEIEESIEPDLFGVGDVSYFTGSPCKYCDKAKADGLVEEVEKRFRTQVEVFELTPEDERAEGIPYFMVHGERVAAYEIMYDSVEDRRLDLVGRIAKTVRKNNEVDID